MSEFRLDSPVLINALTYEGCKHQDEIQLADQDLQQVEGRVEPVHVYTTYPAADVQCPVPA